MTQTATTARGSDRDRLDPAQTTALLLASALVGLALCTVALATLIFTAGGSISVTTLPVAALATGVWIWFLARRGVPGRSLVVTAGIMAATVAVVFAGGAIGGAILDGTFDGRWFHREAIIQLSEGWNPLVGDLASDRVSEDGARARINGYPKAPWILAASIFSLTGRMEWSSAFSFALLVAAAATVFAASLGFGIINRLRAAAIAAVAACNPIALCQLANPLVDGQLASNLVLAVAAAVLVYRSRSFLPKALLFMSVVLAVNTKQSALPFIVLLVGGLMVCAAIIDRRMPGRRHLGAVAAAFAIGVVGVGAHPYITNVMRHDNWAYPHEQKTVTGTQPPVLVETKIGRVHAFFKSAFTRSRHADTLWSSRTLLATESRIKMPYDVSAAELAEFRVQGVRIGGGGPLYGAMLLAAAATMALLLLLARDRALVAGGLVVVVGASVLAFPYPWVFRLVPQAWLIPLVPAAAALTISRRLVAAAGWAVLLVGAVNLSAVGFVWTSAAYQHTRYLEDRFTALAASSPIDVDLRGFRAERLRLVEYGIHFTEVSDPQRWLGVYLGWSRPTVAIDDPEPHIATLPVQWSPVAGTLYYDLNVVQDHPAGPEGRKLTVYQRSIPGTSATVPRTDRRSVVSVGACNLLGCGLPVVAGPFDGTTAGRPWPQLGVPSPGGAVETPFVVAWLPATEVQAYGLVVEDAESGERRIDASTEDHFFLADLPPHRSWRITVTAVGDDTETAGRTVEFRTTSLRELALRRPPAEAVLPEGPVQIEWTGVAGATSYEYLVMVSDELRTAARGVTTDPAVQIHLAADGESTRYSAIVRACPASASCRGGRDRGWGPWSTEAGTGAVNFTVVSSEDRRGSEP